MKETLQIFLKEYERLPIGKKLPIVWLKCADYCNSRTDPYSDELTEEEERKFRLEFPTLEEQRMVKCNFIQLIILGGI